MIGRGGYRGQMSRGESRRSFRRGSGVHRLNYVRVMRGGYRI